MIACENLVKIYKAADLEVVALQGLDLQVEAGELMGIIGNSGSGKSTLLNMLGGLDRPSAGKLTVGNYDLLKMSDADLVAYKRETVGFVWQNNARNLIPYLTALQNVELPMLVNGTKKRDRAKELLELVGLGHRMKNRLNQLSGGEQQRVAIAIALANQPKLLLADEPTGSVDTAMSNRIMDLFRELNRTLGLTIVIVTHDVQLAKKVDRVVAIRDGRTSSEILRKRSYAEGSQMAATAEDIGEGQIQIGFEPGESNDEETHVELAVVDQAGRLQIPREYLKALGVGEGAGNKLRVELEEGRIVLRSPDVG